MHINAALPKDIGPEQRRQYEAARASKARLWGRPGARPGANMPLNGKAPFRNTERPAVDFIYALKLVCDDQQITSDQMFNSTYSAAIAARHMLWTVLFDGRHPVANIARLFNVDHCTVRLGIESFRKFQKSQVE